MEGLKLIPYIALIIAIAGIIIGASAITLGKFGDTVDKCYNSSWVWSDSAGACINATSTSINPAPYGIAPDNMTAEWYNAFQASESEVDISEQIPTVAIIAVMTIIISIIAGVFVYMKYFS